MAAQRRTVFKLAGAGVALGTTPVLAACGGVDQYGGGARRRDYNNKQLRIPKDDIPVGSGRIYPDQGYVITRPSQDEFRAFSSVCPHAGCPVQAIEEDQIHCLCHNSTFAIEDGSRIDGPTPTGLEAAKVTDAGDEVIISFEG